METNRRLEVARLLERLNRIKSGLNMTSTMHEVLQAKRELQDVCKALELELEQKPVLRVIGSGNA